jgi:hypothetical protein
MDSGQQGVTSKQIGANISFSVGEYGEPLVTELQPRFYEQTYRGNTFTVQYTAGALAAPSATVAGLFAFYNPTTSGKNVVLLDTTIALASFSASTNPLVVELQPWTYVPTSQTALTPVSTFIGGPASVAKAIPLTAGTLVGASTTPIKLIAAFYLDLAAGDSVGSVTYNFDGKIVIAPGSGFSFCALATVPTHTAAIDLTWTEIFI